MHLARLPQLLLKYFSWTLVASHSELHRMCRSLADNELSGQLPPAWLTNASFPALVDLYLSNNRLEGTLPSELLLGQLQVRTMLSAVTRKTDKGP